MKFARELWLWCTLLLLGCAGAASQAAGMAGGGTAFERRAWTPIDGAPAGAYGLAQDADGLLWFASPGGLYRYDGEKFARIDSIYGHRLRSSNVLNVMALRRGIAVLYQFGGMSVFSRTGVRHYGAADGVPPGGLGGVLEAPDGKLYVGTPSGLAVLEGERWRVLGDCGLPRGRVIRLLVDHDETMWVLLGDTLYGRAKGSAQFTAVAEVANETTPEIVLGKLVTQTVRGTMLQIQLGRTPLTLLEGASTSTDTLFQGPLGTVWAWLGKGGGLVHLRQQADGRYTVAASFEAGRMNKSVVLMTLIDREGNLWLSTPNGVERLRAQRVHDVALPATVFSPYVHRGLGDDMLMAGTVSRELWRISERGHAVLHALPDIQTMWRENSDSLWAGSARSLHHITHAGVRSWTMPASFMRVQLIQAITVDSAGTVWVSVTRSGLFRFDDGLWTRVDTDVIGEDAIPITMRATAAGKVWLGFTSNRIGALVDGVVRKVATSASADIGNVLSLQESAGQLIVGGENGLAWVGEHGSTPMLPEQIEAFRGVSGLALDRQGQLWLHGTDGIYRVPAEELTEFRARPAHRLKWERFSLADGVRGNPAQIRPLPTLALADDGRVFYATNSQVGWIDPHTLRRNLRAPDLLILGVRVGQTALEPQAAVQLAAGTDAVEIRYAVTALSVPEKVQIRFRLSGVDQDWQVPSGERVARYTNLAPGHYTFQVIAANEDGVWNNEGATLGFEILPKFWQTLWFRVLVALLLLAGVLALHRWRLAMAAARAAERTAARIEERERIARNLHDNLLQGVHALILRSDTILKRLPKDSQEGQILETVLGQAEKLVEVTRDEVMDLRSSQSAAQFVAGLRSELQALGADAGGSLTVHVSDGVERLRPEVARELCQVLREAVTNAVRHARAATIRAELIVSSAGIEAAVLDDGVGIAADVAQSGRSGHWGIVGMRERVARLGGTITIGRNGGTGTALRVRLDAATSLAEGER